jgi:hypothetical protein
MCQFLCPPVSSFANPPSIFVNPVISEAKLRFIFAKGVAENF